jgi:hypothetical protein
VPTIPAVVLTSTLAERSAFLNDWENAMIETIAVLLVVMWLLGMLTHYTLGGLIHILLVLAVIAIIIRLVSGRRPVV